MKMKTGNILIKMSVIKCSSFLLYMCIYTYMYICVEREERGRERDWNGKKQW